MAHGLNQLPAGSPITVANLSYDGLVQAGVLRAQLSMADLADGRLPVTLELRRGWPACAYRLRTTDDLPMARVHLFHLHGPIGWLRIEHDQVVKCELDELRGADYWRRVASGRARHTPAVVLTDRKDDAVALEPFALAYRIFADRLSLADHWLVAGYSFGDVPVNRIVRFSGLFICGGRLGNRIPTCWLWDAGTCVPSDVKQCVPA